MLGVARTVRAELAMDFATLELEYTGAGAEAAIVSVLQRIHRARIEKRDLDPDMEYAWFSGAIHLSR